MAKTFYILGDIDNLLEVLILPVIEYGVIDDDAINGRVVVAGQNCLLNVILSDEFQRILEATEDAMGVRASISMQRKFTEIPVSNHGHIMIDSLVFGCLLGPVCVNLRSWVVVAKNSQ